MSEKKLMESLNYIDEDMVEAADSWISRKGGRVMLRNIAAAAATLIVGGGIFWISVSRENAPQTVPEPETVTASAAQTSPAAEKETRDDVSEEETLPEAGTEDGSAIAEKQPDLTDEFTVTKEQPDPADEDLLAFCAKRKIDDPGTVTQLIPSTFPEDCEIRLYEVEGEIWGFYNGKVTSTPLNRKEQTANANPVALGSEPAEERRLTSAALADYDENGVNEVYYTTGLGENASSLMVYYPDRPAILQNEYYVFSDVYNLLHLTNWVRQADDQCFRMLAENEGRMVAAGEDGELRVYTAFAQDRDGELIVRRGDLIIDSFGESLVRESMLWKSFSRVTDGIGTDPDYDALNTINMPKNVVFGMTPEEVLSATVQIPEEVSFEEAGGVQIIYRYSFSIMDQNGTESDGILTTTLSFNTENLLTSVISETDSPVLWDIVQDLMSGRYPLVEKKELSGTAPALGSTGSAQGYVWDLPNAAEIILVMQDSGEVSLASMMMAQGYEGMKEVIARQKKKLSEKDDLLADMLADPGADGNMGDQFFTTCYPDTDSEDRLKDGCLVQGGLEDELLDRISAAAESAVPFYFNHVQPRYTLGAALLTEVSSGTAMIQVIGDDCRMFLQATQEGYGSISCERHNENKDRTFCQYVITDRNAVRAIREVLDEIQAAQEPDRRGAILYTTDQDMIYIYDYKKQ